MTKPILITGAAGFIGSNMVAMLRTAGHSVVALDNLSHGHREYIPDDVIFEEVDCRDQAALSAVMQRHQPCAVMHFAALIAAGESMANPDEFYAVNTLGTLNLLNAMRENNINNLIFSSTAAVYGEPTEVPLTLQSPTQPINPYGQSKRMAELMIADYTRAYNLNAIAFRYFNVAGCSKDGKLMQKGDHITHLIPLTLRAAAQGTPIQIYGDDYPTADGTCIRDYIHVLDICAAHKIGLERLLASTPKNKSDELKDEINTNTNTNTSTNTNSNLNSKLGEQAKEQEKEQKNDFTIYNLGSGQGYSVKEVIDCTQEVTGKKIEVKITARRTGDPSALIADASAAQKDLGWIPEHGLSDMIKDGWQSFAAENNN